MLKQNWQGALLRDLVRAHLDLFAVAALAFAAGVRISWLVLHGRNVGGSLIVWVLILVICLGIFAPTHNQYAAAAAVIFGPGKNSDRLQRDIVKNSWPNERYWPLFR